MVENVSLSFRPSFGDNSSAGFSTIEGMVAIAILGLTLMPLYAFQGSIVSGTARIERTHDATAAARLAETFLRGLVPQALEANGAQIGDLDLSWSLERLQSERFALTAAGSPGRFRVGFVRVDYEVTRSGRLIASDSIYRVSWTETGPFLSALDG